MEEQKIVVTLSAADTKLETLHTQFSFALAEAGADAAVFDAQDAGQSFLAEGEREGVQRL